MTQTPLLPEGFAASAVPAGIRRHNRLDVCLLASDRPRPAAAVWTRNLVRAAPLVVSMGHMEATGGMVRAVLVNSANANCATGARGIEDAHRCARAVAEALDCPVEEVLVFSTGVIGTPLPVEKIEAAVPALVEGLSREGLADASRAIMTTDTGEKRAWRSAPLPGGGAVEILGMAKGSGMIHPDMATMLAYLFTEALPAADLRMGLRAAVDATFNCLTVDGDTSTNDAVLLWSSGARRLAAGGEDAAFQGALEEVCTDLARQIAADGEGASRLVQVRVTGALTREQARACARTVATSPLVKTAVHGRDPNWGRILAAAGRSGATLDPEAVRVGIGGTCLYDAEGPHPEREREAHLHLEQCREVVLWLDLGRGGGSAVVHTCDLSADYVRINADYRS